MEKLKNNWFFYIVALLLIFLVGYTIWSTQAQRAEAPTIEEERVEEGATEAVLPEEIEGASEPAIPEDVNKIEVEENFAGDTIIIDFVLLADRGYVVIHEDVDGDPGEIIGASLRLLPGENEELLIELSRPSEKGEVLYAILHTDDGDERLNTKNDQPILDSKGEPIMAKSTIIEQPAELGGRG